MTNMKGYRTFLVNGAVASIGVVTFIAHLWVGAGIAPGMSLTAVGLALANAYLRSITTTPPGKAQPPTPIASPTVTASSATTPPQIGGTSAGA